MCSTAWQDCDAAKRWEPRCLTSMATGPWYRWGGAWGRPVGTTNGWRGCDEDERQSHQCLEIWPETPILPK